jgi:hypothetical protein
MPFGFPLERAFSLTGIPIGEIDPALSLTV